MSYRKLFPFVIGGLFVLALSFIPSSNQRGPGDELAKHFNQPMLDLEGERQDEGKAELSVNVSLPQLEFNLLLQMNEAFMVANPRIKVNVVNELPVEKAYQAWEASSALGSGADVMLLDNSLVRLFAIRGYLKPTDGLLAGDVLTNQLPSVIDALKWNGYLWGVPHMINPYIWFWNDHATESLLSLSKIENWDEWELLTNNVQHDSDLETAVLDQTKDEQWLLAINPTDVKQLIVFMYQFQANSDRNLLHVDEWQETELQQLQWLQQQIELDQVMLTTDQHTVSQLLEDGKLLAAILPWSDYFTIAKQSTVRLVPDSRSIVFPWMNGTSYVIAAKTKYEKEAIQWIEQMTALSNQQAMMEQFHYLPTTLNGYNSGDDPAHNVPSAVKQRLLEKPAELFSMRADPLWRVKWQQWEEIWKDSATDAIEQISKIVTDKP
ncbi:extracellular solute-binding protein [Paenibacillus yanchengensis]|uniref:Extracellular solute-binding protein n=1 Tax=Paenibacillus yanchengensis TaxID=2035833 RepID=A0ABW4YLC8_9BACL